MAPDVPPSGDHAPLQYYRSLCWSFKAWLIVGQCD
jgi:hypothetical protein